MTALCLTMIVRNEAAGIDRWLGAVAPFVAYYVVCDTGSTDDAAARIRATMDGYGIPGEIHDLGPQDGARARNEALDRAREATARFDYLLLIDPGMVLTVEDSAFPGELEAAVYLLRERDATTTSAHPRLLRRDVPARYTGLCDEVLDVAAAGPILDGVWLDRDGDGATRRDTIREDVEHLTEVLAEGLGSAHDAFSLARCLQALGRFDDAIAWYRRRIELDGREEERWYAHYMIAACHWCKGDEDEFVAASWRAFHCRPFRPEPLYHLARYYRETGRLEGCFAVCEIGRTIPYPEDDRLFVEHGIFRDGWRLEMAASGYACAWPERQQAGREACLALAVDRWSAPDARNLARQLCCRYGVRAEALFGEFTAVRIPVETPPPYSAMNHSIFIDGEDRRSVVRAVNYGVGPFGMIFDDSDRVVRSRMLLVTLDADYRVVTSTPMERQAAEAPVCWACPQGLEDCRLVRIGEQFWLSCSACDRHPEGRSRMVLGELTGNVVTAEYVQLYRADLIQKNWMPVVRGDELCWIYALDPLIVLRFDPVSGDAFPVATTIPEVAIDHLRGGSPALRVRDGWLLVVHESSWPPDQAGAYLHRFVLLDEDFVFRGMTDPFSFVGAQVEFCAGLARDEERGKLVVSFGVLDGEAWVGFVDEIAVLSAIARASGYSYS